MSMKIRDKVFLLTLCFLLSVCLLDVLICMHQPIQPKNLSWEVIGARECEFSCWGLSPYFGSENENTNATGSLDPVEVEA